MPKDEYFLAKAAAYMYAEAKLKQSQIAERLNVGGQSGVSKLLAIARENKWLIDQPRFDRTAAGVDDAMLVEIKLKCHDYLIELEKKLDTSRAAKKMGVRGLRAQDIRIVSTGEASTEAESYDRRLRLFAQASTERVAELLSNVRNPKVVVGVSWGKTIRFLCEHMEDTFKNKAKNRIEFVPVVGESLNSPNARVSASTLAAEFHRAVKGDGDALSFGAVACYIPAEFSTQADEESIRRLFSRDAGYQKVFGKDNQDHQSQDLLINRLDALITSVGTAWKVVNDPYLHDTEKLLEINRDELSKVSVGNISGYLLSKPSKEAADRVVAVNRRWTGITEDHLLGCSLRSTKSGSPGVIVLAIGKAKADIVRECASRGLINQLIIDEDLASSLAGDS